MKKPTASEDVPVGRLTREVNGMPNGVSPRERDVIWLLSRGLTTKGIAKVLGITTMTVKHHISHLFCKLDVDSRVQLVLFARKHGLVDIHSPLLVPEGAQGHFLAIKDINHPVAPLDDDSAIS